MLANTFFIPVALLLGFRKKYIIPMKIVWAINLIFSTVVFVYAFIYFTVTGLGVEACGLIDWILSNSSSFDQLTLVKQYPWATKFKDCLYSRGANIDEQFNISGSIPDIVNIIQGVTNLSSYMNKTYAKSQSIADLRAYLQAAVDGTQYVYNSSSDDTNPSIAIENFNKWASYAVNESYQYSTGHCNVSLDEWRFDHANCTNPAATSLSSSFSSPQCFSIPDSQYTDLNARYTNSFGGCSLGTNGQDISTILESYFNSTKLHMNDVTTKFSNLDDTLEFFLASAVAPINSEAEILAAPVATLSQGLADLIHAFNNSEDGILTGLDCGFVKLVTSDIQDNFCLGFVVPSFSAAIVFAFVGLFGQMGGIVAFLIMRKIQYREPAPEKVTLEKIDSEKNPISPMLIISPSLGISPSLNPVDSEVKPTHSGLGSLSDLGCKPTSTSRGLLDERRTSYSSRNNALPGSLIDLENVENATEGEVDKVRSIPELEATKKRDSNEPRDGRIPE